MQNIKFNTIFRVFLIFLVCTGRVHSEYIAQIDIQQAGIVNSIYIKLLENDAPLTVQNFRQYVADGDYTNSFFHRSIPNFIVQSGGFTFDSTLNDGSFTYDAVNDEYLGGLQEVPKDAAVINEFGNSNVRGTLAMAKIGARYIDNSGLPCFPEGPDCTLVEGTGADSATNEWFVNLSDNSANLDFQNDGFTVFAEVLENGMDIIDGIASQPVFDGSAIHSAFADIPLVTFSVNPVPLNPVIDDSLIRVNAITEVLSITPDIHYGVVTPSTSLQPEIVILNTGVKSVLVGNIGVQNSLSLPFSIVSDKCSNRELSPGQRCSLIALFSPKSSGFFEDSFEIELPELGINYHINLTGEGGPEAAEPDITSSFSSVDFGSLDMLFNQDDSPYLERIFINNSGDVQLDIFNIALSVTSDSEFTLGGNCFDVISLASGEFCTVDIVYLPLVAGSKSAQIIIESNDPDESPFEIPVFAIALPENDGVDSDVENAAPNNGDGNNDDTPDSQQSHVASLPDINGTYVTYVSVANKPFINVQIFDQSTFDANQDDVTLLSGVHEFTLDNLSTEEIVEIGLLLPANVDPSAYYIYGSTQEDSNLHWYKFEFDGETGASFLGVAKFTSPTGNVIERSVVLLKLKNGGRGDSSNVQDNKLIVKSGINYSSSDSGGGFLSFFFLQLIALTFILLRLSRQFFVTT